MKKKNVLITLGVLIALVCVIGVSYAIWQLTLTQTDTNIVTTGCFNVTFQDTNPINIEKGFPITDEEGKQLTPYTFTIKNNCESLASYQMNLEVLDDSTLTDYNVIKAVLDNSKPKLLTSYNEVDKTLTNAVNSFKLKTGYLNANEEKTFNLRLWLDENTPMDKKFMNKVFNSKITVISSYLNEAPLGPGTLRSVTSSTSDGMWSQRRNITKIIIQDELKPIENAENSFDESVNKDGSVMSYLVKNEDDETYTAYLQSNEKLYLNPDSSYLYCDFNKVTNIEGMEYLDTSNVTDMSYMFSGLSSVTSLDLTTFNTSSVTNMKGMFSYMNSLTILDLSSFNTSSVTDMSYMFSGLRSVTSLDLTSFDTSNVIGMGGMFSGMYSLASLDLSSFDTSSVTNMSAMFLEMRSVTSLNLTSFDTSNVTDMNMMFYRMSSVTSLDLTSFDTSNVTDMSRMFLEMMSLTSLDLSSFNTSSVTDMSYMFSEMRSVTSLNLTSFDTSSVTDMSKMFKYSIKLENIDYGENFIHKEEADTQDMYTNSPANKPTHVSWNGVSFS